MPSFNSINILSAGKCRKRWLQEAVPPSEFIVWEAGEEIVPVRQSDSCLRNCKMQCDLQVGKIIC